MELSSKLYDSYLHDLLVSHPDDEPLMRAAIEAFDSIQLGKCITPELLQPIIEAASDSRILLYDITIGFLQQLTEKYEEACDAVVKMAKNRRYQCRFNAIISIGKQSPLEFKLRILRQGLGDKSSKVRGKAADWIGRLRLKELVPELEEAFAVETKTSTKDTIEFNLKLLRDGYILKPASDGRVSVTTFIPNGIMGSYVAQTELETRGIQAIISDMLKDRL